MGGSKAFREKTGGVAALTANAIKNPLDKINKSWDAMTKAEKYRMVAAAEKRVFDGTDSYISIKTNGRTTKVTSTPRKSSGYEKGYISVYDRLSAEGVSNKTSLSDFVASRNPDLIKDFVDQADRIFERDKGLIGRDWFGRKIGSMTDGR